MALLGFKKQFAVKVVCGMKQQTVRQVRKNKIKTGDTAHCYTGLRTKQCELLGRWPITSVKAIIISHNGFRLFHNGEIVPPPVMPHASVFFGWNSAIAKMFATADGFNSVAECKAWFLKDSREFYGEVIQWDYTNPIIK